jgi:hypothetical protein
VLGLVFGDVLHRDIGFRAVPAVYLIGVLQFADRTIAARRPAHRLLARRVIEHFQQLRGHRFRRCALFSARRSMP